MTNDFPFKNLNGDQICYKISFQRFRPIFEKPIDNCYKILIESCWDENKDKRPTFEDIIEELRNSQEFINKDVDDDEFRQYIKFIDEHFEDHDSI